MIKNLVFSGGGIRAICFIGFLEYLYVENLLENLECILSVSGGSIFAFAYLIGYSISELKQIVLNTNFETLIDIRLKYLLKNYGLDKGEKILKWLIELLKNKGFSELITFEQLYNYTHIEFIVTSTNLSKGLIEQFSYKTNPNMPVLKAIKMSMSIPFIYTFEHYKSDIYVDGGLMNNYPLNLLNSDQLSETLGCKLQYSSSKHKSISSFSEYIYSIFNCINKKNKICYKSTVIIETKNYTSISFNLKKEDKKKLLELGYNCTKNYFLPPS